MNEETKTESTINKGLNSSLLKVLASDADYTARFTEELGLYGNSAASMAYLMGYIQGLKVGARL